MNLRSVIFPAVALILSAAPARANGLADAVKNSTENLSTAAKSENGSSQALDTAFLLQKAADTPHFWQRDPRGGFENDGRDYCSPVAVSNSLVYLAHHGFPALLDDGDGVQPQIDLINTLASADYFGTDPENGTSPGQILAGVRKYVEEKGYACERLEYEGWRSVGSHHASEVKASRTDLDWIKSGILDHKGVVWLNIGWYTRTGDGEWKRTGGHWVTLVGFGATNAGDEPDPTLLLIHNPATHGSDTHADDPAQDVVHLKQIDEGTLHTGKTTTEDAAGMYQIVGPGLPTSRGVDAFLDDAIVLVIKS